MRPSAIAELLVFISTACDAVRCISANFNVDSSSRFRFRARTNIGDATDRPIRPATITKCSGVVVGVGVATSVNRTSQSDADVDVPRSHHAASAVGHFRSTGDTSRDPLAVAVIMPSRPPAYDLYSELAKSAAAACELPD